MNTPLAADISRLQQRALDRRARVVRRPDTAPAQSSGGRRGRRGWFRA